ncbi:MAG: cob(I)yrinic acid a,c-diamide adenosyltransferase [Opitutales bacterium]|nr:cob(I)yrinic acid a,c-diamide adenosyltransferase [Opitutales bacterium]MCH8540117.1 cob(I)yrinic acid a,c-diamide adenosyltransferase [Opitutales bacterium]
MSDSSPKPLRIATRRGDDGQTDLLFGQRVSKTHPQIIALGAIDELNSMLGVAKAFCEHKSHRRILRDVQKELIAIMGEVACPSGKEEQYENSPFTKMAPKALECLDAVVTHLENLPLTSPGWATPGEGRDAAFLDMARSLTRRAERELLFLKEKTEKLIRPVILQYLNRLSDLLWLLARQAER